MRDGKFTTHAVYTCLQEQKLMKSWHDFAAGYEVWEGNTAKRSAAFICNVRIEFLEHLLGQPSPCGLGQHSHLDSHCSELKQRLETNAKLRELFQNYTPQMYGLSDPLQLKPENSPQMVNKPVVHILTEKDVKVFLAVDIASEAASGYRWFVQAASQTNANESPHPEKAAHPRHYCRDNTQGPKVQMDDPIMALARWHAFQREPASCDFLVEFRKQKLAVGCCSSLTFEQIFEEKVGYLWPRSSHERHAARFLEQHGETIKINIENVYNGSVDYVQILAAAFDLSKCRNMPAEQQQACTEAAASFLKIQYKITAQAAIAYASENPSIRVPLVLTLVGGGVFENPKEAVMSGVMEAIDEVQQSKLTNINIILSCYKRDEVKETQKWLEDKDCEVIIHRKSIDFSILSSTHVMIAQESPHKDKSEKEEKKIMLQMHNLLK